MELSNSQLAIFITSTLIPPMLVAYVVTWIVRINANRLGLLDEPGDRKVHLVPTPLGGGIGIWAGFFTVFAVGSLILVFRDVGWIDRLMPGFARQHLDGISAKLDSLWILIGSGTLLALVGLADDKWAIGWKPRLASQFLIALFCVAWQGWRATAFISVPLVPGLLSVVWIVAMINSFNMLDNMDGLSGGVAFLASTFLAAVLLISREGEEGNQQLFVAGLLIVLAGSLLGFLFHNRPPAAIFMGDGGSYFIGFVIAAATLLATYTGYHSKSPHGILAPLFVMAVPMYDMLTVIWIRLRNGKSPFEGDKNHLSHRLCDLGLTKTQSVLTIYLLTATCGMAALILHRVDFLGAVIMGTLVLCIMVLIAILESTARRRIREKESG
ncbi:MAG: MraY family glycosyltransferase [Pirellulaceae bacterium]|nr:MraY family glycosyltransferase [Pirellulaceae bacterium]